VTFSAFLFFCSCQTGTKKNKNNKQAKGRLAFSGDMVWRRELPRFGSAPGFARPPVPERSGPA
jgi:hypothetical protein